MIQFIKYGLVGAINFIFSFALFYFLLKILLTNYLISFTLSWLFGIFLTYIINFIWVFRPNDKIEFKKRFPKCFIVYLISYLVNIFLLKILVLKFAYDPLYLQFAIIPLVMFINFFGFKYWGLK